MWDWLGDNAWAGWFGAATLLAVTELMSMDFVLLMLGFGLAGGGVADLVGAPLPLQILVAVIVAMGTLVFVRPSVVRRLHHGPEITTGHAALVGRSAVVTEEISAQAGQIRLAGEIWTARPYDDTLVIPTGSTVDVFEIKGATAVVFPVDSLGP
ncbi:MAG TPA: NfeD family protein [Nocardioidaceae bacterium]|nr:NfeD family protein [Nocardioidaceae bacterium]